MSNLCREVNKIWSKLPSNKMWSLLPNKKIPIGIYFGIVKKNIVNSYQFAKENIRKDIHTYNLITYAECHFPKTSESYPIDPKVKEIREKALNNFDNTLTPFNITEKQVNKINQINEKPL